MKNFFINILFFGTIILLLILSHRFTEYQNRNFDTFEGYSQQECYNYYMNYKSNYPENF